MVVDDEFYRNRFSLLSIEFIKLIKYLVDITKRLNITIQNKIVICNGFNDNFFL